MWEEKRHTYLSMCASSALYGTLDPVCVWSVAGYTSSRCVMLSNHTCLNVWNRCWAQVLSFLQHSCGLMCKVSAVETSLAWKHQPVTECEIKRSFWPPGGHEPTLCLALPDSAVMYLTVPSQNCQEPCGDPACCTHLCLKVKLFNRLTCWKCSDLHQWGISLQLRGVWVGVFVQTAQLFPFWEQSSLLRHILCSPVVISAEWNKNNKKKNPTTHFLWTFILQWWLDSWTNFTQIDPVIHF